MTVSYTHLDVYKRQDLARRLNDYVPPIAFLDNATRLFKLLLLNYTIHNADAHLKNFALTYTSLDDVAPVSYTHLDVYKRQIAG